MTRGSARGPCEGVGPPCLADAADAPDGSRPPGSRPPGSPSSGSGSGGRLQGVRGRGQALRPCHERRPPGDFFVQRGAVRPASPRLQAWRVSATAISAAHADAVERPARESAARAAVTSRARAPRANHGIEHQGNHGEGIRVEQRCGRDGGAHGHAEQEARDPPQLDRNRREDQPAVEPDVREVLEERPASAPTPYGTRTATRSPPSIRKLPGSRSAGGPSGRARRSPG